MTFLAILTVLALEQQLLPYLHLRRGAWIGHWLELHQSLPVPEALRSGPSGLLGLLLPPLLAVALVWMLLESSLELAGWVFSAAILLYSLGPGEIGHQVRALEKAPDAGAAGEILGLPPIGAAGIQSRELALGIVLAAYRQTFAVLAWFLVLGPVGALLYRLSREVQREARDQSRFGIQSATERLNRVLDWVPARLMAGLLALAGCFEPAREAWRQCDPRDHRDAGTVPVACAGRGALQLDERAATEGHDHALYQAALRLVRRALVLLLGVMGLIALAAWL